MIRGIIIVLFCILSWQNLVFAAENDKAVSTAPLEYKEERLITTTVPSSQLLDINRNFRTELNNSGDAITKSQFEGMEFEAITVSKGSKFYVKSLQPMNSDSPTGSRIEFDAEAKLFPEDKVSRVIFTGEIIENKPPRLAGRSATIKLQIFKVKVDNVSYSTKAYISKVGKKPVLGGILAGAPIYMANLADVADNGTITIDKVYKDPCQYSCEAVTTPLRPLYYLGGAVLQFADLLIAPIVCIFQRGKEIDIPASSSFEIKLSEDMPLLRL